MPQLDKFTIANALREIGSLLRLKGENAFRARAYMEGADALERTSEDIAVLVREKRLVCLRGIGPALASQISELHQRGRSGLLERLRKETPPGLIELSNVPGLGLKKIELLHKELGVTSLADLKLACELGRVKEVAGFGQKMQANILEGIKGYELREQTILLLDALELTEWLLAHLRTASGTKSVQVAGEVRRWKDTIGDIKLVSATSNSKAASSGLKTFPLVSAVESESEVHCKVRLASGIKVELFMCRPEQLVTTMHAATGSDRHLSRLQEIASRKNISIDRFGIISGGIPLHIPSEPYLYEKLGLPYIPPELREDEGEIEEALTGHNFDDLLRLEDIRGMVHCHTVYSDGRHTIEEMASAAQKMGMQYITITDHSPAASYAGGLEVERLYRQWDEIARVQEKVNVRILRGAEVDILEDGALDYPDKVLQQLDVIVASIHQRLRMDEKQMTRRLINCMKQPFFKIWGHPLGRLVMRRDPLSCDVLAVLDAAAEANVAIEVNGDPHRLDMEPVWLREARARGLAFVISVDAHSTGNLNYLKFGVHTARRGGLRKGEVLNTLPANKFIASVRPA